MSNDEGQGLQGQIDSLRTQVTGLATLVGSVTQEATTEREEVAAAVAGLEESVAALFPGDGAGPPAGRPAPEAWVDYASADAWVELADWVDWLNTTYDLRSTYQIKPCWPAHLGVAEELAALWSAWKEAAVAARQKEGDSLAFWHDRYLAPLLARMNTIYSSHGCTNERHEDTTRGLVCDRTLIDVRSAADPADEASAADDGPAGS